MDTNMHGYYEESILWNNILSCNKPYVIIYYNYYILVYFYLKKIEWFSIISYGMPMYIQAPNLSSILSMLSSYFYQYQYFSILYM